MRHDTEQTSARVGRRMRRREDRRRDHGRRGHGRLSTRAEVLHPAADGRVEDRKRPATRLPVVIYVLALGTFLMGTTEFVVAGLLPEIGADLQVSVARAGLLVTVFAVGMIVGAPLMAMLTLRLPRRLTLMLALGVFAMGHVIVAVGSSFALLLAARFLTALATGAFWAVANVVAARTAPPAARSRALGVVGSGAMLATVIGVPLGAFAGQLVGWRGPFWALAALAAASTLASALTVSAFNLGTAVGSWTAGLALDTGLGATGPAVVGTAIAALTLIPTTALAATQRHRSAAI